MFQKNKWKKVLLAGAVIVLSVGITGCGDSQKKAQSSSSKQNTETGANKIVRMGCVGQSSTISEVGGVAQELGYFEEELKKVGYGLEVIGFAQAGPAINEAFSAGEIDTAIYGDMPATVCKSSGVDNTIFAVHNSKCQMGILVQKDSGIKSAADLKGHKVIVARGTIYHQYFNSLIENAGIKESDIEQINTFSDASAVMSSGDADALITSTSIAYYMEEQGVGQVIETSENRPEWTSQFFAVGGTGYLKENPEAAKAIIKALIKAQEYIKDNKADAYELMAKRQEGYTKELYEKVFLYDESFNYFSPEIKQENIDKLNVLEDFMEAESLISTPVDMESFVDNSYYEAAVSELNDEK